MLAFRTERARAARVRTHGLGYLDPHFTSILHGLEVLALGGEAFPERLRGAYDGSRARVSDAHLVAPARMLSVKRKSDDAQADDDGYEPAAKRARGDCFEPGFWWRQTWRKLM